MVYVSQDLTGKLSNSPHMSLLRLHCPLLSRHNCINITPQLHRQRIVSRSTITRLYAFLLPQRRHSAVSIQLVGKLTAQAHNVPALT